MNVDDIRTVSVIGAGDMGHGIAEVALLAGYKVFLQDIKKEFVDRGVRRIYDSLNKFIKKGRVTIDQYKGIQKLLLKPCVDLKEAVRETDLVIEAIPEIPDLKKKIFQQLDQNSPPHTLLTSNTSSIKITDMGRATSRPEKVMGLHFFNPVVLMRLVEVVRGDKTSEETMKTGYDFCRKINKIPVLVKKDVPGFIVNRINAPAHVLRGLILDEGIARPEEIDALFKKAGMPMGPFELLDYAGVDVHYQVLMYYAENLHPDYKPCRTLEKMMQEGRIGRKAGKGFYDWSDGRPDIDLAKSTDKLDPMDITAVQINEATKLIEMGVCSGKDIDKAFTNGTGNNIGPMTIAKNQDPSKLTKRLERLAEISRKEIFRPTRMIREGTYR